MFSYDSIRETPVSPVPTWALPWNGSSPKEDLENTNHRKTPSSSRADALTTICCPSSTHIDTLFSWRETRGSPNSF